ncbi:OmpL47-type beta-barrel domain-containing protein [Paenibacillus sp. NPDC056579]|uniref:OmpL47-type beta-barrel domain-containing protein n=1 Tax=Paenibacillus sp. NPDC056579 TaxID=3345871 RepID=UPI0036B33B30
MKPFLPFATLLTVCIAILTVLLAPVPFTPSVSASEEPMTVIDENADYSKLFYKTSNIAISSSSPERYGGDSSRFYKTSNGEAYVIYETPNADIRVWSGFQIVTWYNRSGTGVIPGDMSFEASPDNSVYTPMESVVKTVSTDPLVGGWGKVSWDATALPAGTRYVKIVFGDTAAHPSSWAIQIGKSTLYSVYNRLALQEEIDASQSVLNSAVVGNGPGQYPQAAATAFASAIEAARAVNNNPDALPNEMQSAYNQLKQARSTFLNAVNMALNWPAGATITSTSSSLNHITVTWPAVMEANQYAGVTYHVYRNGSEAATVTGTTYTFNGLKPQAKYEFSVVTRAGTNQSKLLGPAVLATSDIGAVPAPDFSLIDPDDFADEDYISPEVWVNDRRGIPYYYKHFHTVANAVRLDEPDRGFIDIVVHRDPKDNFPYNARIQENHLWFTYFYTNRASWNIYYGMPQVKYRLEAVLEHLLSLQSPQGAFSEYSAGGYNLPGTSFALQFLGQTVRLLEEAKAADPSFPSIDEALYNRVIEASRKAIVHVLNDSAFWTHGTAYTNQYTLMWSATAAYLAYHPDAAIDAKMRERFDQSAAAFISPAGFYYENSGYDMGYNVGVHIQNMMTDYYYFKNTDMEQKLVTKESKFIDWLSYNLVREPDGSFFTSNAAPSGRTDSGHYARKDIPLAEKLPLARAFVKTRDEAAAEIVQAKSDIVKNGIWPNVPALSLNGGNSYNPYGLYNRILYRYYPTEAERAAAVAQLPYLASERFNHQRNDDRSGLQFTYVRRPDYYAAFNAGPKKAAMQAFGIGLLWHPQGGIMVSSQTESSSASTNRGLSWGTMKASSNRVYENGNVLPTYRINGQTLQPAIGHGDVAQGQMEVQYNLGTAGTKSVTFLEDGISVQVQHAEPFVEYVPIVVGADDQVMLNGGSFTLVRGNAVLHITFDEGVEANLEQKGYRIYDKRIHMLKLQASGSLTYTMTMSTDETAPVSTSAIVPSEPAGDNGWYTGDVTVTLNATDEGTGVARTEYRLNGGEWRSYEGSIPIATEGTNVLEYRSSDQAGNTEEIRTATIPVDRTAPTIIVVPDQAKLWPPNGRMTPIRVTVQEADSISGISTVTLDSIVSSEPDTEGVADADYGTNDTEFRLKAERAGEGSGRVYTITYTAADKAGHKTSASVTITVPHDAGQE